MIICDVFIYRDMFTDKCMKSKYRLEVAEAHFEAQIAFDADGTEITDCYMIMENDTLYLGT
jgi:hypothetical protein